MSSALTYFLFPKQNLTIVSCLFKQFSITQIWLKHPFLLRELYLTHLHLALDRFYDKYCPHWAFSFLELISRSNMFPESLIILLPNGENQILAKAEFQLSQSFVNSRNYKTVLATLAITTLAIFQQLSHWNRDSCNLSSDSRDTFQTLAIRIKLSPSTLTFLSNPGSTWIVQAEKNDEVRNLNENLF